MYEKKKSSKKPGISDYFLPPIKNVPTTELSKNMVGGNQRKETSTETCKPINLPSFRADRCRKSKKRGSNSTATYAMLAACPKMQATSCRGSTLSVDSINIPVPRGAMRTTTSTKFLPPLYTDSFPSLRVQAMVVQ